MHFFSIIMHLYFNYSKSTSDWNIHTIAKMKTNCVQFLLNHIVITIKTLHEKGVAESNEDTQKVVQSLFLLLDAWCNKDRKLVNRLVQIDDKILDYISTIFKCFVYYSEDILKIILDRLDSFAINNINIVKTFTFIDPQVFVKCHKLHVNNNIASLLELLVSIDDKFKEGVVNAGGVTVFSGFPKIMKYLREPEIEKSKKRKKSEVDYPSNEPGEQKSKKKKNS